MTFLGARRLELALGTRGRSAGQWDIWQAVYSGSKISVMTTIYLLFRYGVRNRCVSLLRIHEIVEHQHTQLIAGVIPAVHEHLNNLCGSWMSSRPRQVRSTYQICGKYTPPPQTRSILIRPAAAERTTSR